MSTGQGPQIVDLPPEHEPLPRRPPRRGLGLVLLLTVLLGVTALAGSRPRSTAGQGSAGPSTALPAVGSCLRWDVDPAAPLSPLAGSVTRVGCRMTHQGQVLAAWRPGELDLAALRRRCPQVPSLPDAGHPASDSSATDWTAPAVTQTSVVISSGPTSLDFAACVAILRWKSGSYSVLSVDGALVADADTGNLGPPPDVTVSWCLDGERRSVGCHQPHPFERVGVFSTDGVSATPATTCQARARSVIGNPALVSGLAASAVLTTSVGTTTEETLGGSADVTFLLCDVVTPAGRQLVDTVIGRGRRPLPLG